MLDAADILIDRQPVALGARRRSASLRRGAVKRSEVPGRVDEGVHRVGLAPRRLAAARAGDMLPGRMAVERIAGPVEGRRRRAASPADPSPAPARRRTSRSGSPGSGSPSSAGARCPSRAGGTARLPLGHRPVAAPLALEPVARLLPSRPRRSRPSRKRELIIVPSLDIGLVADLEGLRIGRLRGTTTGRTGKLVFAGEVEVALVVGRAAEDGAGAVVHQNEVRDIDRQLATSDRTDGRRAMPVSKPFFSAVSMTSLRWCRGGGIPR